MSGANGKVPSEKTTEADLKDEDTLEVEALDGVDDDDTADEDFLPDTDNVGEASVELNVDDLIAEMEAEGVSTEALENSSSRRRIDDMLERRRMSEDLLDVYDLDME